MLRSATVTELVQCGPRALARAMNAVSRGQVLQALEPRHGLSLAERACRLFSPAADALRVEISARAAALTRARFHGRIRSYAALPLGSPELAQRAEAILGTGTTEVVLCAERLSARYVAAELVSYTAAVREYFSRVGLELWSLGVSEYRLLRAAGACSVTIFPETFDERDFRRALDALEAAAAAGFRELGLGAQLGLAGFRDEGVALAVRAGLLAALCPSANSSISLCLRYGLLGHADAAELEHLLAALRVLLPEVEIGFSAGDAPELCERLAASSLTRLEVPAGCDRRASRELRERLRAHGSSC